MTENTDNSQDTTDQTQTSKETSIVNPDGTFVENWYAKYDKADHPTLLRFKKFDDLVTSHMSQRKKFGHDPDSLVQIPKDDSPDEVRAEFHRKRGVPETAEEYKYERSKELSDKIETSDNQMVAFAQIAKKFNLTPGQFNGIVNGYLALVDKDIGNFDLMQEDKKQKEFEAADKTLKKELGSAYDERVARANMLLRKYEGNEMVAELGLENNPKMTMFLDRIASDMSEDRIKGIGAVTAPTTAQISSKIIEVRTEMSKIQKENPATFKNDPRYKELLERKHNLYKNKSA